MVTTKHTIVALVQDKPGVLTRVATLFRRRFFNIESIAVGTSEVAKHKRMTIVVVGDDSTIEQVRKQVAKLIEVPKVSDITHEDTVTRQLGLIKVKATAATRSEIMQIVAIFRANIIDVAPTSLIIEVTGDEDKVQSLVELLRKFGVQRLVCTGPIALIRGADEKRDEDLLELSHSGPASDASDVPDGTLNVKPERIPNKDAED